MYIPNAHKIDDPELVFQQILENPFAMLVTTLDGHMEATHLPILLESTSPMILCGHLARQNKQWRAFDGLSEAMMVFSGPHGYVSPSLYVTSPNVPTWNYVAIHAYGAVEVVNDEELVLAHLQRIVSYFDPSLPEKQPESTDPNYYRRLMPGIVAFQMKVERLEGKAKLNRNKSDEDRLAVAEHYSKSTIEDEIRMGKLMLGE